MRVAIVGTRKVGEIDNDWFAEYIPAETTQIISGGAEGIDAYAERYAVMRNLPFQKILPDYKTYGKRAPIVRNHEIVNQADRVVAFWDGVSSGTASVIQYCLKQGIPIEIVPLP